MQCYWERERIKDHLQNRVFFHVERGWIEGFQCFLVPDWYSR
jgi:hypothetical protein